jgi:hypothetical protein
MKLKETHVINDLLGSVEGKITYGNYEKLVLTEKVVNNSGNIHLNLYDKNGVFDIDLCIKTMDSILSNLQPRKILLINPKSETNVFEYDYNGVYCKFKIHRWVEDSMTSYEIGFIRNGLLEESNGKGGFMAERHNVTPHQKIMLDETVSHLGYVGGIKDFYFYNVVEYFFRQILFIELSENRVKIKEILPNSKNGDILKGNLLKNETRHKFHQVDSLWNVKSISVGEFKVRGHFRLQKCGVGNTQVKLIFIDEFLKTKYERKSTRELVFG